ncbi:hypothetical protein [Desulfogranum japonicum]|uniref:hypothetical protein n=1 Tax=Desulfogranum japonicum TaxID=231447 RepID=UPI0003FB7DE7|nr:hypothetical protein [Desulfogranum japonicum]
MKKKKSKKSILGVGWYKKEQWSLLREKSEDVKDLEDTYYEWLANANDTINKLSNSPYRIKKIEIDVEELIEWCIQEKSPLNGESRSKYIALKTKEKFR